jgi:hypothetical protein
MTENELRDWQAHPSYTHNREIGAIKQLLDAPSKALFVGDYGATIASFFDDLDTTHLLAQSITDAPETIDHHYNVNDYNELPELGEYDTIIAAWLDWPKRPRNLIVSLREALAEDSALIIETADETSQYCTVLESLQPEIKGFIYQERLNLLELLTKAFNVERYQVSTSYHFQTIDDFILYFNQHANNEWNRKLSKEEKNNLGTLGERLGYETVGERSVLLKATKK